MLSLPEFIALPIALTRMSLLDRPDYAKAALAHQPELSGLQPNDAANLKTHWLERVKPDAVRELATEKAILEAARTSLDTTQAAVNASRTRLGVQSTPIAATAERRWR